MVCYYGRLTGAASDSAFLRSHTTELGQDTNLNRCTANPVILDFACFACFVLLLLPDF